MAAYQSSMDAAAAQNAKAGQDYLAKVAKEPGVVTLPSGLMYKVIESPNPSAPQPTVNDSVTVNYEGKLIDGTTFDSSYERNQPATFPLAGVVEGWQIGIPLMHKGDTIMLYVPPKLGYGEQDKGPIPPNSALVFKVQLLGINGK
jgi:FKBP-type peptidyl-prolyl cis-trans isomerase